MTDVFKKYTKTVRLLLESYDRELSAVFIDDNLEEMYQSHDDWDGGIDYYSIRLSVPINLFLRIKADNHNGLENAEKKILDIYHDVLKGIDYKQILNIHICPYDISITDFGNNMDDSMWKPGFYRLFVSHLSSFKSSASGLKLYMQDYGVDCFVAHEDIKPSKEWEQEIENALFSMDSLCAIVTEGFKDSSWCDQEIGIAMGQHKMVFSINKGAVPYGFFGKFQALKSRDYCMDMANDLWMAIIKNETTCEIYAEKLINLILNVKSEDDALCYISRLDSFETIDKRFIDNLHSHCCDNSFLYKENVLLKLNAVFEKFNLEPLMVSDCIRKDPLLDDSLPF